MKKYIIDQILSKDGKKTFNQYAEIMNVQHQYAVPINYPYTVQYDALNLTGETLQMFGYITDENNNEIPYTRWEYDVTPYSFYQSEIEMPNMQYGGFEGNIIIGHIGDVEEGDNILNSPVILVIPAALITAALILYWR